MSKADQKIFKGLMTLLRLVAFSSNHHGLYMAIILIAGTTVPLSTAFAPASDHGRGDGDALARLRGGTAEQGRGRTFFIGAYWSTVEHVMLEMVKGGWIIC